MAFFDQFSTVPCRKFAGFSRIKIQFLTVIGYKGITAHYHYDVRFLLKTTDNDEDIQISDESTDLRWFGEVSALPPDSGINIPRMFEKWKNNVRNRISNNHLENDAWRDVACIVDTTNLCR
jgi:hypothetical protein